MSDRNFSIPRCLLTGLPCPPECPRYYGEAVFGIGQIWAGDTMSRAPPAAFPFAAAYTSRRCVGETRPGPTVLTGTGPFSSADYQRISRSVKMFLWGIAIYRRMRHRRVEISRCLRTGLPCPPECPYYRGEVVVGIGRIRAKNGINLMSDRKIQAKNGINLTLDCDLSVPRCLRTGLPCPPECPHYRGEVVVGTGRIRAGDTVPRASLAAFPFVAASSRGVCVGETRPGPTVSAGTGPFSSADYRRMSPGAEMFLWRIAIAAAPPLAGAAIGMAVGLVAAWALTGKLPF